MRGLKNDQTAREAWGSKVYDSIPKSVFAIAAFHLANVASGRADAPGAAEERFLEEIRCLRGFMTDGQRNRAIKVLSE